MTRRTPGIVMLVGVLGVLSVATAAPATAHAPGASPPEGPVTQWTRQFGTDGYDIAASVVIRGSGDPYIAGSTLGEFTGRPSTGDWDAFLRRYGSAGRVRWTRQSGTSAEDAANAAAIAASGALHIAGTIDGAFRGQASAGSSDAFLRTYAPDGSLLWTRQFGTRRGDFGMGVAVDASGAVYIAGWTEGTFPGQASAGGVADAFVRKYSADGTERWTRQFGTGRGDQAVAIAVSPSGGVFVAGGTSGTFPGQTRSGGTGDAFVRKYSAGGTERWTRQFGTGRDDIARGVAVGPSGGLCVAGWTNGALPGQANVGGYDAFVRVYGPRGDVRWTRQFGSPADDQGPAVAVDALGGVAVAGETEGALPGQRNAGGRDAFVRGYGPNGEERWTRQFGTPGEDFGLSVAIDATGIMYLAGSTNGTFPGQTSAGGAIDAFLRKYAPPPVE